MKLLVHAPVALLLSGLMAVPQMSVAAPLGVPLSVMQPDQLTPEQKLEMAKQLYGEGNAALDAGDPTTALQKFNDAYNTYAPDRHVFNFNIGLAAFESGDCYTARNAFQRFLDLVPEHPERAGAQEKILEIDRSGCAQAQPAPTPAPTPTPTPVPQESAPMFEDEDDAPVLESKRSLREDAAEEERKQDREGKRSGMFIGGVVTLSLGLGAAVGGLVSYLLARNKASDLADSASPKDIGFPEGDYSDDDTFNLDQKGLPNNNAATVALLVAGGALTVTGIALLVVDAKENKGKKNRAKRGGAQLTGIGPALTPGGGGVSASMNF